MNCSIELVPLLKTKLVEIVPDLDESFLDLLLKLLSMVSLSNQRTYHGLTAAIVSNKFGLRNHILNKFDAPHTTAEVLKGSNFASDEVFGDLPRWFLYRFITPNAVNLTVKPKPISKSTSNTSNSIQAKINYPAAPQQTFKNQKTNIYTDSSVFRNAKQTPKGGGNFTGKTRGRGRGT